MNEINISGASFLDWETIINKNYDQEIIKFIIKEIKAIKSTTIKESIIYEIS